MMGAFAVLKPFLIGCLLCLDGNLFLLPRSEMPAEKNAARHQDIKHRVDKKRDEKIRGIIDGKIACGDKNDVKAYGTYYVMNKKINGLGQR